MLGKTYTNEYGDIRIPIYEEFGDILYIEKTAFDQVFIYNPYKNRVKPDAFKKWKRKGNKLGKKDLIKVAEFMEKANKEWLDLITRNSLPINEIIYEKI